MKATAEREAGNLRTVAEREAAEVRVQARREADTLRSDADRDTKQLRAATAHEVAELKATVEREVATLRATAEREITQLRAKAAREAEEKRAEATKLLADARDKRDKDLQALAARARRAPREGRARGVASGTPPPSPRRRSSSPRPTSGPAPPRSARRRSSCGPRPVASSPSAARPTRSTRPRRSPTRRSARPAPRRNRMVGEARAEAELDHQTGPPRGRGPDPPEGRGHRRSSARCSPVSPASCPAWAAARRTPAEKKADEKVCGRRLTEAQRADPVAPVGPLSTPDDIKRLVSDFTGCNLRALSRPVRCVRLRGGTKHVRMDCMSHGGEMFSLGDAATSDPGFEVTLRGYDRRQVEAYVEQAEAEIARARRRTR